MITKEDLQYEMREVVRALKKARREKNHFGVVFSKGQAFVLWELLWKMDGVMDNTTYQNGRDFLCQF